MRWAFGVYRCTFAQGRSGTLSCFFVFVNTLGFYFEAVDSSNQASLASTSRRRFEAAAAAREAHLTVSFLAVNPFRIFIFEVVGDPSNQCLRSPFFNRRPLRRGRILPIHFRGSTPVEKLFFALHLRSPNSVARKPHFVATARICKSKSAVND